MEELQIKVPDVTYTCAAVSYSFTETDKWIDKLEKRYKTLVVNADDKDERKEIKEVCADFNKVKKELESFGINTEKELTAEIKDFRAELKKRVERLDEIRKPLWEQVKPKKKAEPPKKSINVKVCYLFEGDADYIGEMVSLAEFNNIKVTEVKL